MPKICDHKSVGMLVWRNDKLLLIERMKPPFGFAVPAGHVDEDTNFEDAAKRELKEEVELDAQNLKLLFEGRVENPCRREDGTWHQWKIYEVTVASDAEVHRSTEETKQAGWYSKEEIGNMKDKLEPVWRDFFTKLGVL